MNKELAGTLLAAALAAAAAPQEYNASIGDTVHIANPFPTAGPADAVTLQSLSPDAWTGEGNEDFLFFTAKQGRYGLLFQNRSQGSLNSDTVGVTVTDRAPSLRIDRPQATVALGQPFRLGLMVEDDGPGVTLRVDFDNDGRVDTACAADNDPALRYTRPTLTGEGFRSLRLRLKAVDNDGHADTASAEVTILFKPPSADAGDNPIACRGLPCRFDGHRSKDENGSVTKYRWDFDGDGKTDTMLSAPEAEWTYDRKGDFAAVLTVTDNQGNGSKPDTLFASVMNGVVELSVDRDAQSSPGETVTFTGRAKTSCGEIQKYFWDFDGDGRWDLSSRQHGRGEFTYKAPGDYQARFMAVTTLGDSASQVRLVQVR